MSHDAAPELFARRQLATVLIDGLCAVGLGAAEHLARHGVGTLLLRDAAPVGLEQTHDVVGLGFRAHQAGRRREDAAVDRLRSLRTSAEVMAAPEEFGTAGVDLQLVVGEEPRVMARLRASEEDQASLPVLLSGEAWTVGPLLGPEAGACPECADLRLPWDGRLPSGVGAVLVAAAAAQQVLALIDGVVPAAVEGQVLRGSLTMGAVETARADVVEGCGCVFARL